MLDLEVLVELLDLVVLEGFPNINDSVIPWFFEEKTFSERGRGPC